ncbi:MAG: DUF4911 domain-containing protein [Desulfobulbus sp.]|nr:DUF4911 domain-containing protein [Desulfobulbus sp.]
MATIVEWFLIIRPEKISWLRFIFEGYDGLAIVSTISAKQGLVRIQTLDCRFIETMRLIAALADDLTPYPVRRANTLAPEEVHA